MKVSKTNAMRILEEQHVSYEVITYECDDFIDGIQVAKLAGVPIEQSFKTLLLIGKSDVHYVFVIPVDQKIDLKKAAKACKEKAVSLIATKDCLKVSGYQRGAVSPFGMKKHYKTFVEETAQLFDEIIVSGGRKGLSLKLNPDDIIEVTHGEYVDMI